MSVRLELRRMHKISEDPFQFNAPPLDIRVRLAVVPPPGSPYLGRVHCQFLRTQQAPERDHRRFVLCIPTFSRLSRGLAGTEPRDSGSPSLAPANRVSLPACPPR